MVGKSTCGRGATGRNGTDTSPTKPIAAISSEVATGRWMNGSEIFMMTVPIADQRRGRRRCGLRHKLLRSALGIGLTLMAMRPLLDRAAPIGAGHPVLQIPAFVDGGVAALRADWTRQDASITRPMAAPECLYIRFIRSRRQLANQGRR